MAAATTTPADDVKTASKRTGFQAVIDDVLKTIGLSESGILGSSPIGPVDAMMPAMWLAARQHHYAQIGKLPTSTTTTSDGPPDTPEPAAFTDTNGLTATTTSPATTLSESERAAVHAAVNQSLGWIPDLVTVVSGLTSGQDLREFAYAVQHLDIAGIGDEIGDGALDVIGMVPVVGAPLVGKLRELATAAVADAVPAAAVSAAAAPAAAVSATAAPAAAVTTDAVTTDAVTTAATTDPLVTIMQWAFNRLSGSSAWIWHNLAWPGTPHQFVDVANNQIDQTLDAADDQLDALISNAPAGTPAAEIAGLVDFVHLWVASAIPNYSFTDTLNAMGDFLNRVVPPFKIADGAGTLSVISVYKIMGAAVAGTATALRDMLNGIYDPQQIAIDVIYTTTGATVTASDLSNATTLGTKVAASIVAGGGAYSNPSKALSETTLPTWTAAQVNPFTIVTYVVLVALYKRFQEISNYAQFTTSTTYESWIYTTDLGSASTRSEYAAGSFHAVDQDGRSVSFQPADGNTYTSAWGAQVTINTYDGGYTYTATLPGEAYFHAGAAGQSDTVTIPVYTADGAPYDVTFQIKIIGTTNNSPTVSNSVGGADALGVVRGTAAGTDADGDALSYSLVGSSVTGLTGNSAYTTNGGTVTLDPSTGAFTYASTSTGGSTASFQVQVTDGHGGLTTTTVTVPNTTSITPANVNTSTQGVVNGSLPSPAGDSGMFSYALGTGPTNGTVTFDPVTGAFTYTRTAAGHTAPAADSFTVTATDANGRTVTLKVPVVPTIADTAPTSTLTTSPYAVSQAQNASGNTLGTWSLNTSTWTQTTTGKLTSSDADGDTPTYTVNTNGQAGKTNNGGTVTVNPDGSFTYTITKTKAYYHAAAIYSPTQVQNAVNGTSPNSAAADWFDVTVSDGFGGSTTQRVYVPIYAVNSAPTISSGIGSAGLGSISSININDGDSEDTGSNFQFSYTSGWSWIFGGKNVATSSLTKFGGGSSVTLTVYDTDGNGNKYYNVDAYGRTTATQGTTKTW